MLQLGLELPLQSLPLNLHDLNRVMMVVLMNRPLLLADQTLLQALYLLLHLLSHLGSELC